MSKDATLASIDLPALDIADHVLPVGDHETRPQGVSIESTSVQINSGALLVFDATLSSQNVADISNSMLLAQLAADKTCDRKTDTGAWLQAFTSTLSKLGWITGSWSTTDAVAQPPVDWCQCLLSMVSGHAQDLDGIGIATAKTYPSTSPAMKIWADAAVALQGGALMVGACQATNGSPNLTLAVVGFVPSFEVTGFLSWKAPYRLQSSCIGSELNEDVYAQIRQAVLDKLGNRPKYLVAWLDVAADHGNR